MPVVLLAPFSVFALLSRVTRESKEEAMRKVLLLALVAMFLGAACNKSEESAPAAPEAAASSAESPAAAPSAAEASPAASPAAP